MKTPAVATLTYHPPLAESLPSLCALVSAIDVEVERYGLRLSSSVVTDNDGKRSIRVSLFRGGAIQVLAENEILALRGAGLREIYAEVAVYSAGRTSLVTFHDGCGVAYTIDPGRILDVVAKAPHRLSDKRFDSLPQPKQ